MSNLVQRLSAAICLLYVNSLVGSNAARFLEEPQNSTVSQGQVLMLRCSIQDRVGPVQWLRDGFGLGLGMTQQVDGYPRYRVIQNMDRGEFHLMISNIQLEDDAMFDCQVGATATTMGLKSNHAKVTVQLPPDAVSIDGGPQLDVISGQTQAVVCRAINGKPAPSITWEKAGRRVIVGISHVIHVQADGKREDAVSQLTLIPTKADQGIEYTCHANNPAMIGPLSASVQLEVRYKPEVTMSVSPEKQVKEFGSVTFTCNAVGNPSVISWRWYTGNDEMPGETSESLRLSEVTRDLHNRRISCEATNRVGSTRQVYTLDVEYGPRFLSDPVSPSADPGNPVSMTCEVDSNPTAAIAWRRKGSSRIISSQSILHIPTVTEEHFTTFTCSASVYGYEAITRDLRVLRRGQPKIISDPEQSSRFGETGILECNVEGIPKPDRIFWTKNGESLDFENLSRYRVREEDVEGGRRSVIEIDSVIDQDFTEYTCFVENSYGKDRLTIRYSRREIIPLPYIVAGVLAGILVIVIISVIVFFYRRKHKAVDSDTNSRSSSDSASVKKLNTPNIKLEYSTQSTVDAWRESLPEDQFPHHSAEYDELRYPPKESNFPGFTNNQYVDRYGDYDYGSRSRDPFFRPTSYDNVYGTYPRGLGYPSYAQRPEPTYGPIYGSDTYASYGRLPKRDLAPIDFLPQPPASPTDSKLSTNV